MPRTNSNPRQTEFYRLLVENFYDGRWNEVMMYGPYIHAGHCRGARSGNESRYKKQYEDEVRRSRIQVQSVSNLTHGIEWVDVA